MGDARAARAAARASPPAVKMAAASMGVEAREAAVEAWRVAEAARAEGHLGWWRARERTG